MFISSTIKYYITYYLTNKITNEIYNYKLDQNNKSILLEGIENVSLDEIYISCNRPDYDVGKSFSIADAYTHLVCKGVYISKDEYRKLFHSDVKTVTNVFGWNVSLDEWHSVHAKYSVIDSLYQASDVMTIGTLI